MSEPVEPSAAVPPRAPLETSLLRIGYGSMPFLPDHAFEGMIVLPGSVYLELALRLCRQAGLPPLVKFVGVDFLRPLVLTDREIDVAVDHTPLTEKRVRFAFREEGTGSAGGSFCTVLEIDCSGGGEIITVQPVIAPENFQQNAEQTIGQNEFYRRLRENGNQYGPQFQGLHQLSRSGAVVVARLAVPAPGDATKRLALDPIAVDAAIQSLMMFGLHRGRTLVLRSIETVWLRRLVDVTEGWVTARLRPENRDGKENLVGDIEVRDDSGLCWLSLSGVTLTALDAPGSAQPKPDEATNVVIAATFTAEPIADVFRYLSGTLSLQTRLSFSPYSQVFQQLLAPDSEFHRNRDGCNVILLNLADWAADRLSPAIQPPKAKTAAAFRELNHCTLPNGLEVAQLNQHETDYVYREIFQDRCYLRHGIRLPDAGTVIDIGANIGLFSLFVRSESPNATILAYEPSPAAFRALSANCEAYGPGLFPFNCGVGERRGHATLTCYEKSSVFSSFHADQAEDRQAIRAIATNVAHEHWREERESVDALVDELLTDRLTFQTITCPVVSVSDIIRENNLQRIDLLKIDAEKCEMEILRGIEDAHWAMIEQLVVEVHDRTRTLLDQVQATLVHRGFHCAVTEENLLTGSGLFNVYATRSRAGTLPETAKSVSELQATADELVSALSAFAPHSTAQTFLLVTPSEAKISGHDLAPDLARIEDGLLRRVRELPRVHALGSADILARYPAQDFYQSNARQLGHIPYSSAGFAAIGASVFRMLAALRRQPFKVIALDCDHTLWQGACGEDGTLGVVVTPAHRALQEFMIRQMEAGMVLCLCSKNHEPDVWSVFEKHPDMVLKRAHIAAARINWTTKSENLRSLAVELNVGLDSFILLDDNPLECAEVHANCPELLVLTLPADPARIRHFLDHVWAFDHYALTAEDRVRTKMLEESGRRENYRAQAPTLQSFIAGLELRVDIFTPEARHLDRLAQLTQRTNQFNFSTMRRSSGELVQFLEHGHRHCLAVHVTDRFGDYGLVGVLLYESGNTSFHVDTFLLSCRVLGRGVEHQVLAELGRRALAEGKSTIQFTFRPTEKNQPAEDFLAALRVACPGAEPVDADLRFPATEIARLTYAMTATGARGSRHAPTASPSVPPSARRDSSGASPRLFERFETIAAHLDDARKIAAGVEAHRLSKAGFTATAATRDLDDTPSGQLLGIWRTVLANPNIGLDDKFFEAGGTSLTAVQIVATIRRELQLPLSVVTFFECPTVRLLSEKLAPTKKSDDAVDDAKARGARRAQRLGKRGKRAEEVSDAPSLNQ